MSPRRQAAPFRRILCPVDFSEHSLSALRYGFELARRSSGRVVVLYVNDPLLDTAAAAAAYDVTALTKRTSVELRRFVSRAGGDSPTATPVIVFGQPGSEIEKASRRLGSDLIVLGSHGLTGARKWFFGSTTERVLRKARVPVLVVPRLRARTRAARTTAIRRWPGARVVVAVDLADYALGDVEAAIGVVRSFGAKALLVYAVPPAALPRWMQIDTRAADRARASQADLKLRALNARLKAGGDCQVMFGNPAEQLALCAASARAGLIVLTLKRAPSLVGPRRGAVTYELVAREIAPVLAIPRGGRRRARA